MPVTFVILMEMLVAHCLPLTILQFHKTFISKSVGIDDFVICNQNSQLTQDLFLIRTTVTSSPSIDLLLIFICNTLFLCQLLWSNLMWSRWTILSSACYSWFHYALFLVIVWLFMIWMCFNSCLVWDLKQSKFHSNYLYGFNNNSLWLLVMGSNSVRKDAHGTEDWR